jgi:phenylacetic acid degradation operon negative regulatory protein
MKKPKTEDLLCGLLWTCDMMTRPTLRNLTDSYEAWAYRNGFLQELYRLEKERFLERHGLGPDERLYRLTQHGRLHALGGRDPEACWARKWDGLWRLVIFDIPAAHVKTRFALHRYLRNHGFGCLQKSVWVTPHPVREESKEVAGFPIKAKSLVFLQANPCGGEKNDQIVRASWNFNRINDLYAEYVAVARRRPKQPLTDPTAAKTFQSWAAEERQAWLAAISDDPLLPESLLPVDYIGRDAWAERKQVMKQAAGQMRSFSR